MTFKASVIEELKYYVYALVNPLDNRIFYIGKGSGNRVFMHATDALASDAPSLKRHIIRDIIGQGRKVKPYILRHRLTEDEAYKVESTLIDLLTYPDFNTASVLTNLQGGHHQWDEGIRTIDEINELYDCPSLSPLRQERLIAVKLNRTYHPGNPEKVYQRENIYEATRKYWRLNPEKAKMADYVLSVYGGIVRAVFKPLRWYSVKDATLFAGVRYAFEGNEVTKSPYLNKDVRTYVSGQSPVRYINY